LRTVFGVIERILEEGDDEARVLLTGGFFDDPTSPNLYDESPNDPRDFVPWIWPRPREPPSVQPLSDRSRRSAPKPTRVSSRCANGATSLDLARRRPKHRTLPQNGILQCRHGAPIGASAYLDPSGVDPVSWTACC
jgi:hypothetical protein